MAEEQQMIPESRTQSTARFRVVVHHTPTGVYCSVCRWSAASRSYQEYTVTGHYITGEFETRSKARYDAISEGRQKAWATAKAEHFADDQIVIFT